MLITLKTLQQQTFKIEIEPSATVRQLKEKIETEKGTEYAVSTQKLIYAGKILNDESAVSEYDIDEKKFVVVMVTKQKQTPPVTAESASSSSTVSDASSGNSSITTTSASATPVAAAESKTPETAPTEVTQSETSSSSSSSAAPSTGVAAAESTIVLGEDYQKMVKQIMEMGYEKDQVERALKASFNNPDRAVEYLITGLPPEGTEPPVREEQESNPSSGGSAATVGSGTSPGSGSNPESLPGSGENPLEFLRSQPQFQQMRSVIQQNPQLLNAVMQQIGQSNPQLLQLITQNQEAFVRMLNEPAPAIGGAPAGGGGGGGGGGGANLESLIGSAQVTPQDKEAIERLKALGFPEYLVVQAYFACDKNENLAANFLLQQGFDD